MLCFHAVFRFEIFEEPHKTARKQNHVDDHITGIHYHKAVAPAVDRRTEEVNFVKVEKTQAVVRNMFDDDIDDIFGIIVDSRRHKRTDKHIKKTLNIV